MKKSLSAFAATCTAITLLFSACQKSSPASGSTTGGGTTVPPNGGASTGNLVKTITLVAYDSAAGGRVDSMLFHYGYDGQNRINSNIQDTYVFSTPSATAQLGSIDSLTDSYGTGSIAETQQSWQNGAHTQTIASTYWLDTSGKMADSSTKTTTNYSGAIPLTTQEGSNYTYDGNGYLTSQSNFLLFGGQRISEGGSTLTVSGGNTTQINSIGYLIPGDTASSIHTLITLTYAGQSANATKIVGNSLNYVGIGSIVLGHSSVDLFQSMTFSLVVGGLSTVYLTELFTYSFDSQNRVSAIVYKGLAGNLIAKAYYAY